MKRILFVCTGNTCRSPMAEHMLRSMAGAEGLKLEVKSAGVMAAGGSPMSQHAFEVLRARGMARGHVSRPLVKDHVEWADLILTMTMDHKRILIQKFPEAVEKTFTLKEYRYLTDDAGAGVDAGAETGPGAYGAGIKKREPGAGEGEDSATDMAADMAADLVKGRVTDAEEEPVKKDAGAEAKEKLGAGGQWMADIPLKLALSQPLTAEEERLWLEMEEKMADVDIADPFGGSLRDYEETASEIEEQLRELIKRLKSG